MNQFSNGKLNVYQICIIGMMTALLCVLSPYTLPIGPIPLSLATMVIYFSVYVIGPWFGTASVALYILLGAFGLPVFSGATGGLGKLAGPTGGYIIGYVFMALIGGIVIWLSKRNIIFTILGWIVATAVLYAFGTAWFMMLKGVPLQAALTLCVYPFLLGDAIKIVVGTLIGKAVRMGLIAAGLIQPYVVKEKVEKEELVKEEEE